LNQSIISPLVIFRSLGLSLLLGRRTPQSGSLVLAIVVNGKDRVALASSSFAMNT
jgi:hypothetical protein